MTERVAKAGAISLAGASFAAVCALVVSVMVGRVLGAAGTGLFFQAVAIFIVSAALVQLGTNTGLVRSLARQRARGDIGGEARTLAIALVPVAGFALLVAVVMGRSAPTLAGWLSPGPTSSELIDVLRLVAPFVLLAGLSGVLQTAARMMRGVVTFTVVQNIGIPATRVVAVGIALAMGATSFGSLAAWLVAVPVWLIVTVGCLVGPIRRDLALRGRARHPAAESPREFWLFTGPRAVGAAVEVALEWVDVLVVAALLSPADAGIYAVATRATRAGLVVDRATRVAIGPSIAGLLSLRRHDEASALHTEACRAMILVAWPVYLTLVVMAPAVMGLFGDDFGRGALVLALPALTMLFVVPCGTLQSILLMGGKSSWQVYNKSFALALSVALNLLLVPQLGIVGGALAWCLVLVADNTIAAVLVHRGVGVRLRLRPLVTAMLAPLAVFVGAGLLVRLVVGTSSGSLVFYLVALGGSYLVTIWMLRHRLGLATFWSRVSEVQVSGARSAASVP